MFFTLLIMLLFCEMILATLVQCFSQFKRLSIFKPRMEALSSNSSVLVLLKYTISVLLALFQLVRLKKVINFF